MDEQNEELMPESGELTEEVPEEITEEPVDSQPHGPLQEADVQAFVREYPGLDPKTIPSSVWEAVGRGETLMGAYSRHELQQLRADNQRMQRQLDVMGTHARSRENSLGSMRSSGAARAADGFLLGFEQA